MTKKFSNKNEDIRACAEIIAEGGIVAFPTETVYGLGANAFDKEAVAKIYKAKGRSSSNPLTILICEKEQFYRLTSHATMEMQRLARDFWPGPLTMVVEKASNIPDITTAKKKTVGVRMPDNKVALDLIRYAKTPLATPSANISGRPSPTNAEHVLSDLDGKIDAIIDSGDCEFGIESTVIDMTKDVPVILRPGMITKEQIEKSLKKEILCDNSISFNHYAPKATVYTFAGDEESIFRMIDKKKRQLGRKHKKVDTIIYDNQIEKFVGRDFYARLRQMDDDGVDVILVAFLSSEGIGLSAVNRLYQVTDDENTKKK